MIIFLAYDRISKKIIHYPEVTKNDFDDMILLDLPLNRHVWDMTTTLLLLQSHMY